MLNFHTLVLLVTVTIVAHFDTWEINRFACGLEEEQVLVVHSKVVLNASQFEMNLDLSTRLPKNKTSLWKFVLVRALITGLGYGIITNAITVLLQQRLWDKRNELSIAQPFRIDSRLSLEL